jgi:hypothetical protein
MKKLLAGVLATVAIGSGIALAAPANAAQGGFDRRGDPHAWVKIGRGELPQPDNRWCWSALAPTEASRIGS